MKNKMKTCKYLYDVMEPTWKQMTYTDALFEKKRLAKRLLKKLNKTSYLFSDDKRINKVLKAIEHNDELINE